MLSCECEEGYPVEKSNTGGSTLDCGKFWPLFDVMNGTRTRDGDGGLCVDGTVHIT